MSILILGDADISALEESTGARTGLIRPVPLADLRRFSRLEIRKFMHVYGLYSFPTTELIDYLAGIIKGKRAIEIGCGHGIIGRALSIPITDSKMQEMPDIKLHYALIGQPTIEYPDDVEKLDARAAVRKYQPDVVIGSYITHKWNDRTQSGNDWGVDTIELINSVTEYCMVGNLEQHTNDDPAIKYVKDIERHDFIVTRNDPSQAVLFRWRKPHFKKHFPK